MSLEKALQENTATMRELIEVLTRTTLPQVLPANTTTSVKLTANEIKTLMADPDDAEIPAHMAKAAKEKKAPAAKVEKAKEEPKAAKVEYSQVAQAINDAVARFQRGPVKEVLAKFNATGGKDLKPEQYEAVIAELGKITDEEELA